MRVSQTLGEMRSSINGDCQAQAAVEPNRVELTAPRTPNVRMKGRIRTVTLPALLGAVVFAGCGSSTGPVPPLTELPRRLSAAEVEVISSSNAFAFHLLREVNAGSLQENVFISPLSVSMALGMTMNGARGDTFDEMRETLGFTGLSQAEINNSYRDLIALLLSLDRTVDAGVANSVWYRNTFPFEPSFFDAVGTNFGAEVEGIDFGSAASVHRINAWLGQATNQRIDKILDSINPDDVMYLINAIYFKGSWARKFEKSSTYSTMFTGLSGVTLPVQMMTTDGTFRYAFNSDYEAVDLPYGNGAFTMTVLMPRAGVNVNDYLETLDERRWSQIVSGMGEGRIGVSLPRFRLEYDTSLNDPLEALGIESAFDPGGADFTAMSSTRGRDLYISSVKHKAFVEVNEEGTEAAAVTKVTISVTSAPPSIRFDRPFVFAIRERFSGTILFTGKIVAPTESG